jgi:chitodextrinase
VGADTLQWWTSASGASNLPMPSYSGQEDSTLVQGLNPETTYSFVLRTFDEAGNVSGFSNVCVATTDPEVPAPTQNCTVPASAPSQFTATVDSEAVVLSWTSTSDPLARALHLWRATGTSGPLSLFHTVSAPSQTVYRDSSVQPGRTYRYRATWSDSCGDGPATASVTVSIPDAGSPGALASAGGAAAAIHAYPNPSTDAVHFLIHVVDPSGERVQLRLFDPSGRVIADIADGSFPSGNTVISWPRVTRNGARVAPGYYESIGTIGSANVRERLILLP